MSLPRRTPDQYELDLQCLFDVTSQPSSAETKQSGLLNINSHSLMRTVICMSSPEVLRLHPPGGVLFRECTRPYKIPGSDLTIEKGTLLSIPVIGLHNDPDYFQEPEKFYPDRFSSPPPKGIFLPFGDGPRNCIANRLALLEMKIFLARLLMKHNVILHQKTKMPLKMLKNAFFAAVDGGLWLQLEKRQAT